MMEKKLIGQHEVWREPDTGFVYARIAPSFPQDRRS